MIVADDESGSSLREASICGMHTPAHCRYENPPPPPSELPQLSQSDELRRSEISLFPSKMNWCHALEFGGPRRSEVPNTNPSMLCFTVQSIHLVSTSLDLSRRPLAPSEVARIVSLQLPSFPPASTS